MRVEGNLEDGALASRDGNIITPETLLIDVMYCRAAARWLGAEMVENLLSMAALELEQALKGGAAG